MKCELCELGTISTTPKTGGRGSKKAKIVFISDAVLSSDEDNGVNFSDGLTPKFINALKKRGVPEDDLYFTSVVKCPTRDVRTDEKGELYLHDEDYEPDEKFCKACYKFLEEELEEIQPQIVVPMGNKALKYTMGKVGLTKFRGKAIEKDGRVIFPMLNFRMMGKRPAYKEFILSDMKTLASLYEDGMQDAKSVDWLTYDNLEDCLAEIERLKSSEFVTFDLETTGLNPFTDDSKIVCISLSDKSHYGRTFPLHHRESPLNQEELDILVKALKELLENDAVKVAHNGKFDIKWLKQVLDIDVKNFSFDTMLAHYLAICEDMGTHGLKGLAWEYTDVGGYDNKLDKFKETLPESLRGNYDNIPWDMLAEYASADADVTSRLYLLFKPLIEANEQWTNVFYNILMPGSYMLANVETNGFNIDPSLAKKYEEDYLAEQKRIQDRLESYPEVVEIEREKAQMYAQRQALMKSVKASDRTDEEKEFIKKSEKYKDSKFKWGSVNQLRELLFGKLGLTTTYKTDKGELSTGEDALVEMSEQHELPRLMMEYRKISTLKQMFIDKLPGMVDKSGRVHPNFNLSGTVTGRLSADNPNMQQIPRTGADPFKFAFTHEIKRMFVSRFGENGCIVQLDFSSLELRIAAMISADKAFTDIFKSGIDMHKAVASQVFKVPLEDVTKDIRSAAKAVNFGILYGKSGVTFGRELHPDKSYNQQKELGDKLVKDYLDQFPQLRAWMERTRKHGVEKGYVKTIFGRYRRLPNLKSTERGLRADAERQCINAPIQGSGSDMTVSAMVDMNQWLKDNNMKSKIVCNVHDSIVGDCTLDEVHAFSKQLKHFMENSHLKHLDTDVPIIADIEMGDTYGSMYETDVEELESVKDLDSFKAYMNKHVSEKWEKVEKQYKDKGLSEKQIQKHLADLDWGKWL